MTTEAANTARAILASAARAYREKSERTAALEAEGMTPICARTKTSLRTAWNRVKRAADAAMDAGIDSNTVHEIITRGTAA